MKALVVGNTVVQLSEESYEVHPSATWMDAPEGCEEDWILINGSLVEPERLPIPYKDKRMMQYPEIMDQLDMLWHAIDEDKLDKTSDFYTKLKKVKDDNPKG